jgi:hypothetical protein
MNDSYRKNKEDDLHFIPDFNQELHKEALRIMQQTL